MCSVPLILLLVHKSSTVHTRMYRLPDLSSVHDMDVRVMMPHDIINTRLIFCACPHSLLFKVQVLIILPILASSSVVVPLIATVGVNNKVTFLEKGGTGCVINSLLS